MTDARSQANRLPLILGLLVVVLIGALVFSRWSAHKAAVENAKATYLRLDSISIRTGRAFNACAAIGLQYDGKLQAFKTAMSNTSGIASVVEALSQLSDLRSASTSFTGSIDRYVGGMDGVALRRDRAEVDAANVEFDEAASTFTTTIKDVLAQPMLMFAMGGSSAHDLGGRLGRATADFDNASSDLIIDLKKRVDSDQNAAKAANRSYVALRDESPARYLFATNGR